MRHSAAPTGVGSYRYALGKARFMAAVAWLGLGLGIGIGIGLEIGIGIGRGIGRGLGLGLILSLGLGLGCGGRHLLGTVVWYGAVDVVRDVRGADAVVQPVDQRRVGSVDGEECTTPVLRTGTVRPAGAAPMRAE